MSASAPIPFDPLAAREGAPATGVAPSTIGAAPELSELALVARVRAGDRDAFEALHARYARLVHAVVLAHGPADEAADLSQEVFLRAFTGAASLREAERAGAWLAGIARNVARDRWRSRRPSAELPAEVPDRRARGPVDEAREVLSAIRSLPEAYRETLTMRLVEQMTGPEIAERSGLTHGSVRVNLHRGMKLLTEELSRRGIQP